MVFVSFCGALRRGAKRSCGLGARGLWEGGGGLWGSPRGEPLSGHLVGLGPERYKNRCWHFGREDALREPQGGPRRPKTHEKGSRSPQEAVKTPSWLPRAIEIDWKSMSRWHLIFWLVFCSIFYWFSVRLIDTVKAWEASPVLQI